MAEMDMKTIESDSKCRICLSFYTEPRLLSCYHTFCTPCLAKLEVYDKNITCPLCRMKTCLPKNSVNSLQSYPFQLKQSNEEHIPLNICGLCTDENTAVAKCLDCTFYLCLNCRDYHGKLKSSKNHVIDPLEQLKLEQNIDKRLEDVSEECKEHKKDTTLFCKPCNLWLCVDCSEKSHRRHDVQNLAMLIQSKKKMLLTRTASLKSRISVLGNVVELIKHEENRYYKHCHIVKTNVTAHAECLKSILCDTIDILTSKNLDIIDNIKKKDLKVLAIYLTEIETEQLSLAGLIKTTDDIVNKSPDKKFWREFPAIGKHLDNVLKKPENALKPFHNIRYEWGECNEAKIEELFGKVTSNSIENFIKPVYPSLPIPAISSKTNNLKVFSFELPKNVNGMLPAVNDRIWILTKSVLSTYMYGGKLCSSITLPANINQVFKNSRNELLFWTEQCAMKKSSTNNEECFKVPFENGLPGSIIHNENLLVYNTDDNLIYEVSDQDGIQNKIRIEDPNNKLPVQNMFYGTHFRMKQTKKNLNLAMSWSKQIVVVTNKSGIVLNVFQRKDAEFEAIATDNYGNIFVADYRNDKIDILSEDGIFQQTLLDKKRDGVDGTLQMDIDELGYLCVVDTGRLEHDRIMKIYSYQ
ncbi:tripartite motif-containing protein 45-like [Mytilus californianus]|uniref:tripartite motif-containing protein 45-like n=1 Tax=Mytilus californianus TaxID=6549 RepID=UPI002245CC8E|nr:tripartite motif-containing protein 45-like [Mytilus californianus]